jgi:hypothetical protein
MTNDTAGDRSHSTTDENTFYGFVILLPDDATDHSTCNAPYCGPTLDTWVVRYDLGLSGLPSDNDRYYGDPWCETN